MFYLHCLEFSWHPFSRSNLIRELFYSTEHLLLPVKIFSVGLVGCFILVCGMELDVDVKPCSTSTGHWNYLPRLGNFILNYRSFMRLRVRHSPNKCLTHHVSHSKTMTKQLSCCPYLIGVFQRMFLFVFFSYLSKFCLTF